MTTEDNKEEAGSDEATSEASEKGSAQATPEAPEKTTEKSGEEKPKETPKPELKLPPLRHVEATSSLSLSKLLMFGVLALGLAGFFVCSNMRASGQLGQYWADWEDIITTMPCTPHDEDAIAPVNVQFFFGSYREQGYIFSDTSKIDEKTMACIQDQIAYRSLDSGAENELLSGAVVIRFDPHAPTSIVAGSLELNHLKSSWRMDSRSPYEAVPGLEEALTRLEEETSSMWDCWVRFGVLERRQSPVFNEYTGDRQGFLFQIRIDGDEGKARGVTVIRPKKKDTPSDWQDKGDYHACLKDAVLTDEDWPKSSRGGIYKIRAQLLVDRHPLKLSN